MRGKGKLGKGRRMEGKERGNKKGEGEWSEGKGKIIKLEVVGSKGKGGNEQGDRTWN